MAAAVGARETETEPASAGSAPVLVPSRSEGPGRGGYLRVYRFPGSEVDAWVQEVRTEITFWADDFALVRYRGSYRELIRGAGHDLHGLDLWRDGWDQRRIANLLRERLPEPSAALLRFRDGELRLEAHKQFRCGPGAAEPGAPAGLLPGASPACFELAESCRLETSPYPGEVVSAARLDGGWEFEASERFAYAFATCQASLEALPYRSSPEEDPCPTAN